MIAQTDKTKTNAAEGSENESIVESVKKAIERKEIFEIISFYPMNDFPLLRSELEKRGWKQKIPLADVPKYTFLRNYSELRYTAEILKDTMPNFIWTYIDFKKLNYPNLPYYNRLVARQHDNNFTLKTGLAMIYQRIHWFNFNDTRQYILPRCYVMNDAAETEAFMEDYRLTVCLSFLYELTRRFNFEEVFSLTGNQSVECIDFALEKIKMGIDKKEHLDIDKKFEPFSSIPAFKYYKIVYRSILENDDKIKIPENSSIGRYMESIMLVISEAKKHFPHLRYDGYRNIWIAKPSDWDCGNGIKLFDDDLDAIEYVNSQANTTTWIVQKYIERPLLAYKTKFDCRQYFMITMDDQNMKVWIYKNSYFRFCGHEFTLDNLAEHFHLTNHAVQQRQPNGPRSPKLPTYNAWTLADFLKYLTEVGQVHMWRTRIYPAMVNCIMTIINATLDDMEVVKNNYQLFGADFMFTEDYYPVLIEINPGPYLTLTNPATTILNTNIVRDLLKVILDYPKSTGDFELVWEIGKTPSFEKVDLQLEPTVLKGQPVPPASDEIKNSPKNTALPETAAKDQPEPHTKLLLDNLNPKPVVAHQKSLSNISRKSSSSMLVRAHDTLKNTLNAPKVNILTGAEIDRQSRALNLNKLERIQKRALQAAHDHKIFTLVEDFPELRRALTSRGWVQKVLDNQLMEIKKLSKTALLHFSKQLNEYETVLMSNLIRDFRPTFVWNYANFNRDIYYDYPHYNMMTARDREVDFTQKDGLANIYKQVYWHELSDGSDFIYPRCYLLKDNAEYAAFQQDFRLTYCTGFLYFLLKLPRLEEQFGEVGNFSSDCVDFALDVVQRAIDKKNHCDIEEGFKELEFDSHIYADFNKIFQEYYKSLNLKIRITSAKTAKKYYLDIQNTMREALVLFPDIPRDGYRNVWIVKPVGSDCCCGYGIACLNSEAEIVKMATQGVYVAQKYLERPMLIYKTKFDIRQYFLITMDDKFINLWVYKNCYLKFSSQEYSLDNLAQSIHVTNHTVQKKYQNGARSPLLPAHNMWVLNEFKNYLTLIKKPNLWNDAIFPGITNSILTVFNGTVDSIVLAKNNFQIFGADFMITEDYKPILIEVNQYPDLRASTVSTKIVCAAVVQDMVKVVVDYGSNHVNSTGDFELAYRHALFNERTLPGMEVVGSASPTTTPQKTVTIEYQADEPEVKKYEKKREQSPNFDWHLIKLLKEQIAITNATKANGYAPSKSLVKESLKLLEKRNAENGQQKKGMGKLGTSPSDLFLPSSVQVNSKRSKSASKGAKSKKDMQNMSASLEKSLKRVLLRPPPPTPTRKPFIVQKVSNELFKEYQKYMSTMNSKAQNRRTPVPLTANPMAVNNSGLSTSIYFNKPEKDNANKTITPNSTTHRDNTISLSKLTANRKMVVDKLNSERRRTKDIFSKMRQMDVDPLVRYRESNELTSSKYSKRKSLKTK